MVAIWAVFRWRPVSIACVAAYVAGTDVLWRMTGAIVPWESSKYLVMLVCLGGLIRLGRAARWDFLSLVYMVSMLPSIIVILQEFHGGLRKLAQPLSFNLSGPLSLFASVWYMSQLDLSRRDVRRVLGSLVAPLLTIAVFTALTTSSATMLSFTDESSAATSGGFGPNQVSLALGLGALLTFLLAVDSELKAWQRVGVLVLLPFFGVQSALTFSRGGLYSFAIALVPPLALLSTHRASRKWVSLIVVGFTLITAIVIVPRLERFTGGEFSARFTDTNPTNRDMIAREDLRLWKEHPILGLGPGGALTQRHGQSTLAHTEFTRLLSEHGLFGVIALCALLGIFTSRVLNAQPVDERAFRTAVMLWSLISMLHAGMRIAAIGFVFGLGCARMLSGRRLPAGTGRAPFHPNFG